MQRVYEQFPDDTDVGTLYAESRMDLRPWDLWSTDYVPRPETPEIMTVLEHVLTETLDMAPPEVDRLGRDAGSEILGEHVC